MRVCESVSLARVPLTHNDDDRRSPNREDGQPKYFIRCEKVKPRVLELTPKQDYEVRDVE